MTLEPRLATRKPCTYTVCNGRRASLSASTSAAGSIAAVLATAYYMYCNLFRLTLNTYTEQYLM